MLDRKEKNTYYTVDNWGMMLPGMQEGDCILSTFEAFIAYREPEFVRSILSCYIWDRDKILGFRHPSHKTKFAKPNLSRDHYIATLLAIWYSEGQETSPQLEMLVRNIGSKLSPGHRITIDLKLWSKSLLSGSFFFWYLVAIPFYGIAMIWNKLLQVLGGFYEEPNEVYEYEDPSWWQKRLRSLRFPAYAHYLASWQNYATPKSLGRRILSSVLRIDTGKWNPATRLLNGMAVDFGYPAMIGGRLNGRTDKTNDRQHMKMDRNAIGKNQLDVVLVARLGFVFGF